MGYWSQPAKVCLQAVVSQWCYSIDAGLSLPWSVSVEPDGCVDLVFAVIQTAKSMGHRPCSSQLVGIKTRPLVVCSTQKTHTIAVQLKPGAMHRLLGLEAHELTDQTLNLESLWPKNESGWLYQLGQLDTFAQRQRVIEQALARRLQHQKNKTDETTWAVNPLIEQVVSYINNCFGQVLIKDITTQFNITPRRLERLFLKHVGVSAKRYARIVRFQCANWLIKRGHRLMDVVLQLGYYDQSHLCREVQVLAGRTPLAETVGQNSWPKQWAESLH